MSTAAVLQPSAVDLTVVEPTVVEVGQEKQEIGIATHRESLTDNDKEGIVESKVERRVKAGVFGSYPTAATGITFNITNKTYHTFSWGSKSFNQSEWRYTAPDYINSQGSASWTIWPSGDSYTYSGWITYVLDGTDGDLKWSWDDSYSDGVDAEGYGEGTLGMRVDLWETGWTYYNSTGNFTINYEIRYY
ncbi:hypothetical protein TWF173_009624 [Orbilia oligospora]|nr:hypothetical protein TWF173_009624 [Orbilia oligospora]